MSGPKANWEGVAMAMIVFVRPGVYGSDTTDASLTLTYVIEGNEQEWYWQYYYKNLHSDEGRRMIYVAIGCVGLCALCCFFSACVCLRHCVCRHACPRICGYKDDLEKVQQGTEEIELEPSDIDAQTYNIIDG